MPEENGGAKLTPVSREIIEDRLLAALDDKNKVALILGDEELDLLIGAIENTPPEWKEPDSQQLLTDMKKLRDAAFGQTLDNGIKIPPKGRG